jgi:hypothetical protein
MSINPDWLIPITNEISDDVQTVLVFGFSILTVFLSAIIAFKLVKKFLNQSVDINNGWSSMSSTQRNEFAKSKNYDDTPFD